MDTDVTGIVDTQDVQRLMGSGAQIVEVLPPGEYEPEQLPGAVNIPLSRLAERAPVMLDTGRPVVVYCFDFRR